MGFLHEYIILPLSDFITGQHIYHDMRFLRKAENWPINKVTNYQNEHLQRLVNYAIDQVPYYRHLGIEKDSIRNIDDLRYLPIVSKQIIRQLGLSQFTAESYPTSKRLLMHSSGSTGEPFTYYTSPEATSINTAAKLLTWYKAGYRLGNHYMNIKRSSRETFAKKIQDYVNNSSYVTFYSLDDNHVAAILDRIEQEKPLFLRSYPAPLALLARYRNLHPEKYQHKPRRIFTTGSNLTDFTRHEIERAFGCDVIDSYSCEGTANTYETPSHDGYHLTPFYGITEILDDNGNPVHNGFGRVVSTDFWNLAQPFIRYDTLDLVEMQNGVIRRIIGHDCETIIDAHGQRLTVHSFSGYFSRGNAEGQELVTAFQIVYRKDQSITFRLVPTPRYTKQFEQEIIDHWSSELGCIVNVECVEHLPLMHNNKRLVIVNE